MGRETRVNPLSRWRTLFAAAWARQRRRVMVMALAVFGWSLRWSAAGQVEGPVAEPKACTRNCGIRTPTPNRAHTATPSLTPTLWRTPTPTPSPSGCSTETTLCLGEGRFLVIATWTKPDGESGPAHAVALTADSGYFWFLDANNVEVAVKALNGCSVNGHSWIFSAGLTNLAVAITVTDTTTNQSKTYSNLQGTPFQTIADTTTFAACPADAESLAVGNPEEPGENVVIAPQAATRNSPSDSKVGCVGSDTVLCLSGRFQVEATWQTTSGSSGVGHATNLTPESGYFWFFDASNVELVVKALDACEIGSGQWFFATGMTTVGVQLTVTDTFTGEVKIYGPTTAGVLFVPILDTAAFPFVRHRLPPSRRPLRRLPRRLPAEATISSTPRYTPTSGPTNAPTPTPGPPAVMISRTWVRPRISPQRMELLA